MESFVVFGKSFIPEETLQQKEKSDKVPYSLWERKGWIQTTVGSVVDYDYLHRYIDEMVAKYNWNVKEFFLTLGIV